MSKYEKAHIALFVPYTLKHTVGDFANSLRFNGWLQTTFQSILKTIANMGAAGWFRKLYRVNLKVFLIPKHPTDTTFFENYSGSRRISPEYVSGLIFVF